MVNQKMSAGQRAYEAKRAAKAGMSLDKWLDAKQRQAVEEARVAKEAPPRKPGLFSRLLDRAHQPLKKG
jgi:hypothetical protein